MIISFKELLNNLKGKMTATDIASSELDKSNEILEKLGY